VKMKGVGVEGGPTHHLEILSNIQVEVNVKLKRRVRSFKRKACGVRGGGRAHDPNQKNFQITRGSA